MDEGRKTKKPRPRASPRTAVVRKGVKLQVATSAPPEYVVHSSHEPDRHNNKRKRRTYFSRGVVGSMVRQTAVSLGAPTSNPSIPLLLWRDGNFHTLFSACLAVVLLKVVNCGDTVLIREKGSRVRHIARVAAMWCTPHGRPMCRAHWFYRPKDVACEVPEGSPNQVGAAEAVAGKNLLGLWAVCARTRARVCVCECVLYVHAFVLCCLVSCCMCRCLPRFLVTHGVPKMWICAAWCLFVK